MKRIEVAECVHAFVDPACISVVPSDLAPTRWDDCAILPDLLEYVQLTRLVKAVPVVRIDQGRLRLVSGFPFIQAAVHALPPIQSLICRLEGGEREARRMQLHIATPHDVRTWCGSGAEYWAVERLIFGRPLSLDERKDVNLCFGELRGAPRSQTSPGLESDRTDPILDWENGRVVCCTWWRDDVNEGRMQLFLALLVTLHKLYQLRSWNGIDSSCFV